jgi:hypothetical protein
MRTRNLVLSLSLVALVAACGGETPVPNTPPAPSAAPSAEPPPAPSASAAEVKKEEPKPEVKKEEPPPRKAAKDVIVGSTFMFSLADSPDAKKALTEECEKKGKKDAKKVEKCVSDGEAAAAKEGVRYEKDDKGNLWYVSFGDEKGKEVIYNKVQFKITDDKTAGKLTVAPEGKDTGKRAMKDMPKELTIELPDDTTLVMADPKKGKLTFKKK